MTQLNSIFGFAMQLPHLQDFLILLGFSLIVVLALQKLKLPSILGFILTGILIGPYALGLVSETEQIEIIAEIGVILLLFVIGMELSIKHLISIKNSVFIGGSLQVGLTVLVAALFYYFMGNAWNEAIFVGFLFSLSSTAIVLKILQERNEINAPHGRNALAILIFQDIIVVPMMLLTPILAGDGGDLSSSIFMLLLKTAVVIAITLFSARFLVPRLLHSIAKTGNKELFLITTITICFAVAFLTSEAGLSLALGAFLAGLIISESEYSHQATSIVLPFRELFTSFFFISIGMLLNLQFFFQNVLAILLIVALVFILKSTITALAVAVLRYPPRTFIITGLSLFQVGEFAFILSKVGVNNNLLSPETNQYFLAVSIVSMLLTPFVILFSERFSSKMINIKPIRKLDARIASRTMDNKQTSQVEINNHLIIIGYGINGSNLAKAASFSKIPYRVIELNPETVRTEKQKGIPIIYGDATQEHILHLAGIHKARVVVIAISDPKATKVMIKSIRSVNQTLHLIVRTRYIKEIPELIALGANDVIPEEFETSIEIFARTLHNFLVPEDDIQYLIDSTRENNYGLFQNKNQSKRTLWPLNYPEINISCLKVKTDNGSIIGQSLATLDLRNKYAINILAIVRNEKMITNIEPNEKIYQRDLLYLTGNQADILEFKKSIS